MTRIGDASAQIADIASVIDGIVFQTSRLALGAQIALFKADQPAASDVAKATPADGHISTESRTDIAMPGPPAFSDFRVETELSLEAWWS